MTELLLMHKSLYASIKSITFDVKVANGGSNFNYLIYFICLQFESLSTVQRFVMFPSVTTSHYPQRMHFKEI